MSFALNHMVSPGLDHRAFFALAQRLGVRQVEIRNDLAGVAITDGTRPEQVRADAAASGLTILSINALQRFNEWNATRAAEARELAAYAQACGAAALVLCPVNDHAFAPPTAERLAGLRDALTGLAPILTEAGITGLVEPLGFAECSLRLKSEAVAAIDAVGAGSVFKLVHDTFHHHVAGESDLFPARTGLVHISGVTDPAVAADTMRDPDRVLVNAEDRIGNIRQLQALIEGGYEGPISFEPFAASVHRSADIAGALGASITFVASGLGRVAA